MSTRIRFGVICAITAVILPAVGNGLATEKDNSKWYLKAQPQTMQWWREARYGMFLCWGPVSLTGLEIGWSRGAPRGGEFRVIKGQGPTPVEVYDNLYKKWKPDKFNARQWVQTALDGGMKYMIFLVKHHDGFCLYDTKLTDYKSTSSQAAWRKDVLADVADACHDMGLKLIIYYSQPDWHHPDYRTKNHHRYIKYLHGQIRELLNNYGKIDGFWFDLYGKPEDWDSENLFKMMRTLQPWLIINNRCGLPGDFETPEQNIGPFQTDTPWESCITLGTQWSWKPDDKIKSLKKAVQILIKTAGRDGNLALNTNPMPDGRIEPRQAKRFREIGQWLKKYGETIYATRGGPYPPAIWGVSTHKDNKIYIHILSWRGENSIKLGPIQNKIIKSTNLTGGTAKVTQTKTAIEISVPKEHRDEIDTIIKLTIDGQASKVQPGQVPAGIFSTKATASSTNKKMWQKISRYAPSRAFDDDFDKYWSAAADANCGWLALDMEKPTTFDKVIISEPTDKQHIRRFEMQYKDKDCWQTIAEGTTIGEKLVLTFNPVTARYVRLNILEAAKSPAIAELQLFASEKK